MTRRHVLAIVAWGAAAATAIASTQGTAPPQGARAALPASLELDAIRALPVQHDGRWMPLDTVARDVIRSVTGKVRFRERDPVLMLLAWTFDADRWRHEPVIRIRNAELRTEMSLPADKTVFSYRELVSHRPLRLLIAELYRRDQDRKLDPLESKVSGINEKLTLLQKVFGGKVIRPIPDSEEANGAWRPIVLSTHSVSHEPDEVEAGWSKLGEAFRSDDAGAFASAASSLTQSLGALPSAYRVDPQLIATELRYNRLQPFRTAWMVMLAGALLGGAALATTVRKPPAAPCGGANPLRGGGSPPVAPGVHRLKAGVTRWLDRLALLGLVGGFAILTYGLSLRWQIAGRIPAANMFESLLFLSWGMGAFAIVSMFVIPHRIVPLTASVMGALSLFLADCLPMDQFVRPIAPVLLDTVWMSIHVPVIMVSYSVLALAVLVAHVQLVAMAAVPGRRQLIQSIDSLHYWYVHVGALLLLAGIVTGSMWAASSWGRYWGWDPKEVWSLVAFLGYVAILHVRIDREPHPLWALVLGGLLGVAVFAVVVPKLGPVTGAKLAAFGATGLVLVLFVAARREFATAAKSIIAFWLIIMTYIGVNFVLGTGLHSYGFGTGAVARYMFLIGGIDLGLVALCSVIYLARMRLGSAIRPPAGGRPDVPLISPA